MQLSCAIRAHHPKERRQHMSRRSKRQSREARAAMEAKPARMESEQQRIIETAKPACTEDAAPDKGAQAAGHLFEDCDKPKAEPACERSPLPTITEAHSPAPAQEGQGDDAQQKPGRRRGFAPTTLALSGIAALACAIACGAMIWANAASTAAEEAAEPEQVEEIVEIVEEEVHEHEWSPLTETVHHDAVTRTVKHPAEYAQQTAYHTVCNECGEVLDNAADQHIEATGHSGYTVNVPREETVLTKDAWNEVVVVQDAYDEVKVNGSICLSCGEVQRAATASE